MTRTDRILAALTSAIERRRPSLDADETTQALTITVKLSEAGYPRLVEVERRERDELSDRPRPNLTASIRSA